MKVLVVLTFAACISLSYCLSDETLQQIMALRLQCAQQAGVAEEVLIKMEQGQFSDDPKSKEFFLCFFSNGGFMSDEGDVEADFMKMAMTDEFGADVANKVVAACGQVSGGTPQDTAFLLSKCLWENQPQSA